MRQKFSNIRKHVEETIVQKLGSVLVLKQKYQVFMCILGALLEMKNSSVIRSEQIQNDVKHIDKKVIELQGKFISLLGAYSRISYTKLNRFI